MVTGNGRSSFDFRYGYIFPVKTIHTSGHLTGLCKMADFFFKSFSFLLVLLACSHLVTGQDLSKLASLESRRIDPEEITPEEVDEILGAFREDFPRLLQEGSNKTNECVTAWKRLASEEYTESAGGENLTVRAAVVALDSFGKPGSGILQGATSFEGAFDECLGLKTDVPMQYCLMGVAIARLADSKPVFTFYEGICVPQDCTPDDVFYPIKKFIKTENYMIFVNEMAGGQPFYTCTPQGKTPYNAGAIIMIVLCCILVLLTAAGSIFHLFYDYYEGLQEAKKEMSPMHTQNAQGASVQNSETEPLLASVRKPRNTFGSRFKTFLKDCLIGFSLYKNIPVLMSTHQPAAAINNLNGMRVISMFWVILGHTYYFLLILGGIGNLLYAFESFMPLFSAQAVTNAFFAVDSFFYISGFLVAYLTFREMKRRKGSFPFLTYYLHRILRLTPTYMFVLFFFWFLTNHLAKGPRVPNAAGPGSGQYESCVKYWWTNLLYINNFYPTNFGDECMGWTWYLANDMQFFVITPLFLITLYASLPIGLISIAITLLASMGVSGFIGGFYEFPANVFHNLYAGVTQDPRQPTVDTAIYGKPYCRIGPYLVGILLGYIIFKNYRTTFSKQLNWIIHLVLWGVAIIVGMSVVYGFYGSYHGHEVSKAGNIAYFMLARPAWGVALAIVTYVCHHGYGGPINKFLSLPLWVPLSRLTFNAYLVHEIVLEVIFGNLREPMSYVPTTMAIFCIGTVVLSYGAAVLVTIFVEFPVSNIEMAAFKLFGVKTRESTRIVEKKSDSKTQ